MILAVQSEYYLVGVADQDITLLGKLDQFELASLPCGEKTEVSDKVRDFRSLLMQSLQLHPTDGGERTWIRRS